LSDPAEPVAEPTRKLQPAFEVLARTAHVRHDAVMQRRGASERRIRRRGIVVGEYRLLLDDRLLSEIIESAAPRRVPGTRSWCRGVVNLRGNLVSVYHLDAYLEDRSPGARSPSWTLVMHTQPAWTAFGISTLPEQPAIVSEQHGVRVPALPERIATHVRDAFRVDGQRWLDVDWNSLCSALGREAA
jgi:chemotaxis signal transduction protein